MNMNRSNVAAISLTLPLLAAGLGLTGCQSAARVAGETTSTSRAAFDRLKALAGTWEMTDDKGQKQVASVFRVTSAGSVVCETMFPGSPHEMTNMYHADGDGVVVTHYCAQGNQPRMRAAGFDGQSIHFTFLDCTNLKSAGAERMSDLTLTLPDADHLRQEWVSYKDGKPSDHAKFELTRRKG